MVCGLACEVVFEEVDLVVLEDAVLGNAGDFLDAEGELGIAVEFLSPLAGFVWLLVVHLLGPATLLVLHASVGGVDPVGVDLV